ncbi:MAG: thermosome subunit, partial [Nitrosarchaeum sp.]|nr:thermosome subunit [Nitrosarchaeum sp.]
KGAELDKEVLAHLIVQAVMSVRSTGVTRPEHQIAVHSFHGAEHTQPQLINGVLLEKERSHPMMPEHIKNAKIALLNIALEIRTPETDARITIQDPSHLQKFLDMEEEMLSKMVQSIVRTGASAVICQKGIDDYIQHKLAEHGILAIRRVSKKDLERLRDATGGTIITAIEDLRAEHLGNAGSITEARNGQDAHLLIRDCKRGGFATLIITSSTPHVGAEIRRAIEDAIGDVASALRTDKAVAGAGATEIALALRLHSYAQTLTGREQLAAQHFAQALEVIPVTLAENAGLDPIDMITALKAEHKKGKHNTGLDVSTGTTFDAITQGIIEPLEVKTQALSSSTQVATLLLRIDDIIARGPRNTGGSAEE